MILPLVELRDYDDNKHFALNPQISQMNADFFRIASAESASSADKTTARFAWCIVPFG